MVREDSVWEPGSVNVAGPLVRFGCPDLSCSTSSASPSLIGGSSAGVRPDGCVSLRAPEISYAKKNNILKAAPSTHTIMCVCVCVINSYISSATPASIFSHVWVLPRVRAEASAGVRSQGAGGAGEPVLAGDNDLRICCWPSRPGGGAGLHPGLTRPGPRADWYRWKMGCNRASQGGGGGGARDVFGQI